jgi:ribose transport system substrate-binding protein
MKRTALVFLVALFTCATVVGGFAQQKPSVFQGSSKEVYYMVDFVSGVEYWVGVYEGFKLAAAQL